MPELEKTPGEKAAEKILSGYAAALMKEGIHEQSLAKQLKRELKAKKTVRVKVKGAVKQENLPKGRRLIAVSGTLAYDKEGNEVFGDGDSVIEHDEVAWDVQQKARMDAQKILGLYAPTKIEHSGKIDIGTDLTPEKWKLIEAFVQKDLSELDNEHQRDIRRREGIPTPPC